MSHGNAFNNQVRAGSSLKLYFEDLSLRTNYMDRINKLQFSKTSRRNNLILEGGDLYKEVPRKKNLSKMNLDASSIDQLDAGENIPLIEIGGRNEQPADERRITRQLRRRKVPKLRYYASIANAFDVEDTKNRKLIDAIERNEVDMVESVLLTGADPNMKYTLTTREAEDLRFTIGTLEPDEQASWTVLHEASSRGHWQCVRLLLDAGANPNAQGVKEFTPLDVAGSAYHYKYHRIIDGLTIVTKMLLNAGGKFVTMKGRNDDHLNTTLHTAVEIKSIKAVKLLLDAGASVACLNYNEITPLHICLQTKFAEVLDVLINHSCKSSQEISARVDVTDSCGFTVIQGAVILNWIPGFRIALKAGAQLTYSARHSKSYLWQSPKWYQLLQSRQTPIHLAVARNNIEMLDLMMTKILAADAINCFNEDGETPLYTAIKQGHLGCVKTLIFEGASINAVSVKYHSALHVAAEYDQVEIMKFLLQYEEETKEIINSLNKQGCTPLHCAAMNNNPECIKILLQYHAEVRAKTLGHNSLTPLHIAAGYNYTDVANIILHHDKTTIDEVDNRGFTPLHVAASNCCNDVMLLLLRNGATLSSRTESLAKPTKTAIEIITEKLPNPGQFFEELFDSFISSEDAFGMTKININFQVLGNIYEIKQMKVVEELMRCGQEKVLIHPFLESLLYIKWKTLLPFFYVMLATYGLFILSLNILVVSVFYYFDKKIDVPIFFTTTFWIVVVYISIFLLLIQELFYIIIKRGRYFLYLETWVKLSSIGLAIVLAETILCYPSWSDFEWPRHVSTVALLLSWVEMMFLLSRFPSWGYYVLMFGNVSVTIILLTFICLVIAFSFSFMIQFQSTPPFDDLWASLIKTMVMMTSEFDYVSLFNDDNFKILSASRTVVRLFFLVFLLFVSIVFMNFMVGVAVSDINNLNIQGNTKRMGKLVELLSTLDVVVHDGVGKILPRKTFKAFKNKRFLHKMSTFPGSEKTWSVTCGDRINKLDFESDCKITLPASLDNAIMNRAKKQKLQKEKESVNKAYMDKIDLLYEAVTNGEQPVTRHVLETTMNDLNAKFDKMSSEIEEMKLIHTEAFRNIEEMFMKFK